MFKPPWAVVPFVSHVAGLGTVSPLHEPPACHRERTHSNWGRNLLLLWAPLRIVLKPHKVERLLPPPLGVREERTGRPALSASRPLSGRPCSHSPSMRRGGWGPSALLWVLLAFLQRSPKPRGLSLQVPKALSSDSYLTLMIYIPFCISNAGIP